MSMLRSKWKSFKSAHPMFEQMRMDNKVALGPHFDKFASEIDEFNAQLVVLRNQARKLETAAAAVEDALAKYETIAKKFCASDPSAGKDFDSLVGNLAGSLIKIARSRVDELGRQKAMPTQ